MTTDDKQTREHYISKCRYYNGNDDIFSYAANVNAADYERAWVEFHFSEDGMEYLRGCAALYENWVNQNCSDKAAFLSEEDGTPLTLKAILCQRFHHWGSGYETPEDFKNWYEWFYIRNEN